MSDVPDLHASSDEAREIEPSRPSPLIRRAWWFLAALPVSFVVAVLLGGWLISVQGYDPDTGGSLPLRVVLVAGVPATLVQIAPLVAAMLLGRAAARQGDDSGRYPMVVGAVLAGVMLVQGTVGIVAR